MVKSLDLAGTPIHMQCIPGDVQQYQNTRVNLEAGHDNEVCWVGLAPAQVYSVILACDWPWFGEVLHEWGN